MIKVIKKRRTDKPIWDPSRWAFLFPEATPPRTFSSKEKRHKKVKRLMARESRRRNR